MDPFWTFARRMLRYRGLVAGALAMAMLSGGSLSAGFVGAGPILKKIIGADQRDLPKMATEFNDGGYWLRIPQGLIDSLPHGQFTAAVWIIVGLGVLTILGACANFLHAYLSLTVVNKTMTNVRRDAFHKVVRLPLKDIVSNGPSDAINRIIADTAQLSTGFTALVSKVVSQATRGLGALVAAFVIDWRLTGVALVVGVLAGSVIRKLGTRIRRASRAAMASQSSLYTAALEALQGLRVVKVHTTERFEAGRFHRLNKQVMRELNRVRTARAMSSPVLEVITLFVVGSFALVAIKAILDRQINPGDFLLATGALLAAASSLRPMPGLVNDIQASSASADRLAELLKAAPEPGHDHQLPRLARHVKSIAFEGVTFTYPRQDKPSLDAVSLEIRHGETVAVVGPNGSGKTTLLALVPRLFEPDAAHGRVLIDGRDIREVSVRSLRRQIGVVTQETVLFRGTIASNIAYGAEGVTQEKILDAAKKARAHEFITAQPLGYDTVVGEQGLTLSGGQRQRLAIARAILRDPSILILDEATSMIDADSEAKIAAALAEFSHGRTCLIVAHRLSTVLNADRIVVMDQGRVVGQGKHADLMETCAVYRGIAGHQLLGGSDGVTERRDEETKKRRNEETE